MAVLVSVLVRVPRDMTGSKIAGMKTPHPLATHTVYIDRERGLVTKTADPTHPNFAGFQMECDIHTACGTGTVSDAGRTLTTAYAGESWQFTPDLIDPIGHGLARLQQKLETATRAGVRIPTLGDFTTHRRVINRCGGTEFCDDYFAALEEIAPELDPAAFVPTHGDLSLGNFCTDDQGHTTVIDLEASVWAPASYPWSGLLMNLWQNDHPHFSDLAARTDLWDPACLKLLCALSVSFCAHSLGLEQAKARRESFRSMRRAVGAA